MLKKAGIVVLGATAGMISLAPLASAGEAPSHGDGDHHSHHEGSCDKVAATQGDNLIGLDNVASNLDLSHVNVLAKDNSQGGGCHGNKAALSSGDSLISADNLLANADVSHVNVLASDNSH